jgi:hypothetical protein
VEKKWDYLANWEIWVEMVQIKVLNVKPVVVITEETLTVGSHMQFVEAA